MGYIEATTLLRCPHGVSKSLIVKGLKTKTTVRLYQGVIELPRWYDLQDDPALKDIFADIEDPQIYLAIGTSFIQVCTMAELFQPPVPSATSDRAILQYASLIGVVASIADSDCAWLTPLLKRSDLYEGVLNRWSLGQQEVFPNSEHTFSLFGCKTGNGFRVWVQRRLG